VNGKALLPLYSDQFDRTTRDRLEVLTALIGGPSFDPLFRDDVIQIPRGHEVYRWDCVVEHCERIRENVVDLCSTHLVEWRDARRGGIGRAAFLAAAEPLGFSEWAQEESCRICPQRPAAHTEARLCSRHLDRWGYLRRTGVVDEADFARWVDEEPALPGFGSCQVAVCPSLADSPVGLCSGHRHRYRLHGCPGGAEVPDRWWQRYTREGEPVPVLFDDQEQFSAWCVEATAVTWPGQINLRGLRPQVRAEIRWGLFVHGSRPRHGVWRLRDLQIMVNVCRASGINSLVDLDSHTLKAPTGAIVREILHELRLIYFTPEESKKAGFLETEQFGVKFSGRASHIDLTTIPQRWLRDLLWDYSANLLRSPGRLRSSTPIDTLRRACSELGSFLELEAPGGGHDPTALRVEHMRRFIADQQRRERDGLPSLAATSNDRRPAAMSAATQAVIFNGVRKLLRDAMETGAADRLGLDREFAITMPSAGLSSRPSRRPFPDEIARAVSDQDNLRLLAEVYDPDDHGLRDVWETIVLTGRRSNEVIKLRWDCIGRYGGLAMFWHDQTKVGNFDVAIRIPEHLHQLLAGRQRKTLDVFAAQHGRRPTATERAVMALFPSAIKNPDGTASRSYSWFIKGLRQWLEQLDVGHLVPHQARHTLATNLLRQGATLTHIRRYLGQVSDRMAEHYVHLTHDDLEDVLQHVWVAGPGSANPGQLLAGDAATALTRAQAQALAVDLSRRSTPAEGGFCTFQPVVDGGACPWNMDCHNCDKFVLSGADLLYWQRKREQWRLLAEGAPDDATADYLHRYFEPTARAIDGLEKTLSGLGLLADALALDLRKPQDYFHRVWSTAFRATDLSEDMDKAHDDIDDEGAA
jgi:integrase